MSKRDSTMCRLLNKHKFEKRGLKKVCKSCGYEKIDIDEIEKEINYLKQRIQILESDNARLRQPSPSSPVHPWTTGDTLGGTYIDGTTTGGNVASAAGSTTYTQIQEKELKTFSKKNKKELEEILKKKEK